MEECEAICSKNLSEFIKENDYLSECLQMYARLVGKIVFAEEREEYDIPNVVLDGLDGVYWV